MVDVPVPVLEFEGPRRATAESRCLKDKAMAQINIQFTLFSAIYSPFTSNMAGGFLQVEGMTRRLSDWLECD